MRSRNNEYGDLDAAIKAAKRFWAGILYNSRVKCAHGCNRYKRLTDLFVLSFSGCDFAGPVRIAVFSGRSP